MASFLRSLGRLGGKIFGSGLAGLGQKVAGAVGSLGSKVIQAAESPVGRFVRGFLPPSLDQRLQAGLDVGKRVIGGAQSIERNLGRGRELSRRAAAGKVSPAEAARLARSGLRAGRRVFGGK